MSGKKVQLNQVKVKMSLTSLTKNKNPKSSTWDFVREAKSPQYATVKKYTGRGLAVRLTKTFGHIKVNVQHLMFFYVLLTVHLSIFMLLINQLDARHFCFTISLFHASTFFDHHVFIIRRSKFHLHLLVSSHIQHGAATCMCDDTRRCIVQFWSPDDEHMVLETCRGMK